MQIHTKQMQYLFKNVKEFYTFAMLFCLYFQSKSTRTRFPHMFEMGGGQIYADVCENIGLKF